MSEIFYTKCTKQVEQRKKVTNNKFLPLNTYWNVITMNCFEKAKKVTFIIFKERNSTFSAHCVAPTFCKLRPLKLKNWGKFIDLSQISHDIYEAITELLDNSLFFKDVCCTVSPDKLNLDFLIFMMKM